MSLRLVHLPETEVEFGEGTATTIKEGLAELGPYSLRLGAAHPGSVNVGLVGPPAAIAAAMAFLVRCKTTVLSGRPNRLLAPPYPGFKAVMHADLNIDPRWTKPIDADRLEEALKAPPREAFRTCLELWRSGVTELAERDTRFDVIVCALPKELIDRCGTVEQPRKQRRAASKSRRRAARGAEQLSLDLFPDEGIEAASQPHPEDLLRRNFRRALKAAAMEARVPIQIVTPGLYEEGARRQQDPATRAWNLTTALFYKAGGIPWRARPEVEHTCFVGISFHHLYSTDSHTVFSSLAQAFSSDGEGFALRGEPLPWDPHERRPQLTEDQIEVLLAKVLAAYRDRMDRDPLRVVVHKTSNFSEEEATGARRALSVIPAVELRTIRSTDFRLLRQGMYPPHRGTLCRVGDTSFLYTTGYTPERATYEGPHVPVPLELVGLDGREAEIAAREILGLTKMNWNSTRDHSAFPISLAFARQVGLVMSEVPSDRDPHPAYRFYM